MREQNQLRESPIFQLVQDARNTNVDSGSNRKDFRLPSWMDSKAVRAGKEFVSRHFFVIFFVHFISLILLLSYAPVRIILIETKRSHTKDLALKRYISTLRHIKLWYEGDLTSPKSATVLDVLKVRDIHSRISKRIASKKPESSLNQNCPLDTVPKILGDSKEILKKSFTNHNMENNNDAVNVNASECFRAINQLDMIVTQYCFMGLITSFPEKFGICLKNKKEVEGLAGFLHIWAIIGHILGIEDRFNLCVGEKVNLKDYILNKVLLNNLIISDPATVLLWNALVSAMSTVVPCLSVHASLLYILEHTLHIDLDGSWVKNKAGLYENFCYKLMIIMFNVVFKAEIVRSCFNGLLRIAICTTSMKLALLKMLM